MHVALLDEFLFLVWLFCMWCVLFFHVLPAYVPAIVALPLVAVAAFWHIEAYGSINWAEMHASKLWQLRSGEFSYEKQSSLVGLLPLEKKCQLLLGKPVTEQWKCNSDHIDYGFVLK